MYVQSVITNSNKMITLIQYNEFSQKILVPRMKKKTVYLVYLYSNTKLFNSELL